MSQYSVYEAKARLSELLRVVKTRGEVVITERGKPIARVVRFEETDETLDERIGRLESAGLIQAAADSPKAPVPSPVRAKGALRRFLDDRG